MPWTVLDLMSGPMVASTKAIGRRTSWRGRECTRGLMDASMTAAIPEIKRMERGVFIGRMGESTTEDG